LGHAARMVPLARILRETNHKIIIGSGEEHISFFRNEIPGITCIEFQGFKPVYSQIFPQYLTLLLKIPNLVYHIIREHFQLKKIIRDHSIDIIISDNRFGLWNRNITSVYVTHMPLIPFPVPFLFLEFIGIIMHRAIINKYSFCFIPDLPGEVNVSGRLSHGMKLPANVRYTGIFSRFANNLSPSQESINFEHNTVVLSGPEPQRSILKQKLIVLLKNKKPDTVILEGKPALTRVINKSDNIACYNHLPASEMEGIIKSSKGVITRSGYTTIMELISLNCSALLIPTPGQTEQEYLAEYLSEKGWFSTVSQRNIKGKLTFSKGEIDCSREIIEESRALLKKALEELLEYQHRKKQS
jgi:UDP:flavonoid glycosyltransferase YjiC (YdhE family)